MANIRLVIEYDGSHFCGWQQQPDVRTVQEELQRVLTTILREPIAPLYAAGRTDSGVHARRQVVNFYTTGMPDLKRILHSVSRIFRGQLSVLSVDVVADEFNARRHAVRKQYIYRIINRVTPPVLDRGKVWHVSAELDIEQMRRAAAALVGRHDFTSMRGARCAAHSPVKEILESELLVAAPYLTYRVVAAGFLKQMVRNIVGTLVAFGRGSAKLGSMEEILAARDRKLAGVTAPGYGLTLDWVEYPPAFVLPNDLDSLAKRRIVD